MCPGVSALALLIIFLLLLLHLPAATFFLKTDTLTYTLTSQLKRPQSVLPLTLYTRKGSCEMTPLPLLSALPFLQLRTLDLLAERGATIGVS